MKAHRALVVLGTRPEAIKQAPVVWAMQSRPGSFDVKVVNTGQHREMLTPMLELLGIKPDLSLDLMEPNQTLASLTARCVSAMDRVLLEWRPDAVVVQGDTTTAMAAGLAAFYRQIPVAHVEAGLRSGSLTEPFPEEANRIWIDAVAHWRFAPTERAAGFLRAEARGSDGVYVTGNTVVDALTVVRDRLGRSSGAPRGVPPEALAPGRRIVLVTCHRRESFGDGIHAIARAIARIALERPDVNFVYPLHMNPNVRGPMRETLGSARNVYLVEPLEYDAFVRVMERATLVLTDSGGVQEEAPSFGVPVLVMRNRTERPEGIEAGCAMLVGNEEDGIVSAACMLLGDAEKHARMAHAANPYGDGHAGARIAEILASDLDRVSP
ncbi:MAG: UDP-N-acetylglucosamine 2-epimerase (non-hydrolyzing) [Deltaproteobacteria bacterium]